jgi:hypothetical protein
MERFTHPRKFALAGGFLMVAMGVLAFIPGFFQYVTAFDAPLNLPALKVETSYGTFLGFIPMNVFNKVALIFMGLLGIAAANRDQKGWAESNVENADVHPGDEHTFNTDEYQSFGLLPNLNTLFGYWPLFGADVFIHAMFSLVGGYFGYSVHSRRLVEQHHHHHTPHWRGV